MGLKELIKSNESIYNLLMKVHKFFIRVKEKIFLFMFSKKRLQQLKMLKDKHLNKRCFIIGNGPSLKSEDLNQLKGEITFASNRIFKIYDQTDWRPTYYLIQDFALLNDISNEVKNIETKMKILPINAKWIYNIDFEECFYFYLNTEKYYPNIPKFSTDISKQVYEGYTVTYGAIQMAVYMGFKEIFLLGVDFNYSLMNNSNGEVIKNNGVKDYFSNDSNKNLNLPNLDYSLLAYKAAKQYADENDIKIYNATRGGKLEVFDRVCFDNLFNNGEKL